MTTHCYSTDEEYFNYTEFGDLLDELYSNSPDDQIIGMSYWRGEQVELKHSECIDIDGFLEMCDERAYDEIGECYEYCFSDVTDEEKKELKTLIEDWAKRCVNIRYWKVLNSQDLKITAEDLR
jgi:hypothetical protein